MAKLQYIPNVNFEAYKRLFPDETRGCLEAMLYKSETVDHNSQSITASCVYSAQIEGSSLNLNSFFTARQTGHHNEEVANIENLIAAYQFALRQRISIIALCKAHSLLSTSFSNITVEQKGQFRKLQAGIKNFQGLVYLAAAPAQLSIEMEKLFADIDLLLKRKLSLQHTLYYAAYIHFLFGKIHPFADGNGRAARLLEKWFMAAKLGTNAFGLPIEKYYWDNRHTYLDRLNIAPTYNETLDRLSMCTPFLQMLPMAVCYSDRT